VPNFSWVGSLIDGFLKSPLSGLAPWVLLSVFSTRGHFERAACIALGVSLLTMLLASVRGISIHALDVFGAAVFAALAVLGLVASPGLTRWLEEWAGEITNISLVSFVIATLIVRKPFTIPYAKEEAPEEVWDRPLFLRINYVISSVLAAIFFAVAFTEFYPGRAGTKASWLPSFVLVAGILGWSAGAVADVVGISTIVAGIVGSALLSRLTPAIDSNV